MTVGCSRKCDHLDETLECPVTQEQSQNILNTDGSLNASVANDICHAWWDQNFGGLYELNRCDGDTGDTVECLACRYATACE